MIAILAGSIKLSADNFLGRVSRLSVGKSGYVVVAAEDGTILAHPDPARINTRVRGQSRAADNDAMSADQPAESSRSEPIEGTRLIQSRDGQSLLTSYKQLNEAPWTIRVSLPLAEAFAPATYVREVLFWVALGLIVVVGFLALRFFSQLLAPLGTYARCAIDRPPA